jgi:hypothetical protein
MAEVKLVEAVPAQPANRFSSRTAKLPYTVLSISLLALLAYLLSSDSLVDFVPARQQLPLVVHIPLLLHLTALRTLGPVLRRLHPRPRHPRTYAQTTSMRPVLEPFICPLSSPFRPFEYEPTNTSH